MKMIIYVPNETAQSFSLLSHADPKITETIFIKLKKKKAKNSPNKSIFGDSTIIKLLPPLENIFPYC